MFLKVIIFVPGSKAVTVGLHYRGLCITNI